MLLVDVLIIAAPSHTPRVQVQRCPRGGSARLSLRRRSCSDGCVPGLGPNLPDAKCDRYMCWEVPYLTAIKAKRAEEIRQLLKYRLVTVVSLNIGRISPVVAACSTFTAMGMSGEELNAAKVFAALAAYNALRMPLISVPLNLAQLFTIQVTTE